MTHELIAFISYYGCAFCAHAFIHLKHRHSLPEWASHSKVHKVAAFTATVGTAAGVEGVQGYLIHLLVYSRIFF